MKMPATIIESLGRRWLALVPIDRVRSEKKKVGLREGWGGEPIAAFPPYAFFLMYESGKQEAAVKAMEDWYYQRLVLDGLVCMPKREGGMADGSLFREVSRMHAESGMILIADMSNADEAVLRRAISQRVAQRFELLKSIKKHGQRFSWDYIRMVPEKGCFTLIDGHHRVAAMVVCGYDSIMAAVPETVLLRSLKAVSKSMSRL